MWFNPPYHKGVRTNVARVFNKMVERYFPKGSLLGKLFNRNNVKVSYCTTRNVKAHIDEHNRRVLNDKGEEGQSGCNCRSKANCPLKGKCQTKNLVYQADVLSDNNNKKMTYYGQTKRTFKARYTEHKTSFNNSKVGHLKSELAAYVWKLKKENTDYEIQWSIKKTGFAYRNGVKNCDLCAWEKLSIALGDPESTLNSRTEILAKCRMKRKYKLSNFITKPP